MLVNRQHNDEAQATLAAIVESSDDAIVSKTPEGVIMSWNSAAERLLGYRADETIGQSITLIVPAEFQEDELHILERLCRGERIEHHETVRLAKGGRRVDVSLTISPVRNKTGRIIGASTIMRDITRRRQREQALRDATARLQMAQEAADLGAFEWDLRTDVVSWSPSMENLYGLPCGGFGRTCESWRAMIHPQDWPAIKAATCDEGKPRAPWKVEFRIIRPDGAVRWMAVRARIIPDKGGGPGRLVGINMDIPERKHAEEALRRSETHFRQLANIMPQIVWVAGADGVVDSFNRRWYEFTGLTEGVDDIHSWKSVLHPDDLPACQATWDMALQTGEPFQTEYRLRDSRTGNYRWFLARALPVRDEDGRIVRWFGTCTDIEDQKRAEATLAQARDQLDQMVQQRTQELQRTIGELESFSYSLSHDMRAPLRAIQSYLQIALQECGPRIGAPEQEYLQKSISAAQRMEHLIQDVLAFTRLSRQEITLHVVDVDTLAREIIQERPEFQPPAAEVRLEGQLLPMVGHEALLTQCLTNIVGNAVKFVAPGVKPQVRIYTEPKGGRIRLWIEDNGIGIAQDAQRNLFGLFHRFHGQYEGTGVGLAIVRKAVERMGGQVGVESEPSHGSRFRIELPAP